MKLLGTWAALGLLVGVALAGIPLLRTSDGVAPADADPSPIVSRVVVHDALGNLLPPASFAAALPAFVESYVGDGEGFEPTLGIAADGTAYYMASASYAPNTGVYQLDQYSGLHPEVWKSVDGGLTWSDISPGAFHGLGLPQTLSRLGGTPPISGDPYIHVDEDTGRVFAYHQQAYVECDYFAITDTEGDAWSEYDTCAAAIVDDESFGDHPTLVTARPRTHAAAGYDNLVHFCSSSGCRRSLDGGFTWSEGVAPYPDCEIQLGHVKAAPDGKLYVPRKACGGAQIAVSEDDGATWRQHVVDDTVWTTPGEPWEGWDHESAVAIDDAGNAYYLWMGEDRLPYLSTSTDAGRTWSAPMGVGFPGLTYSLFPEIVAGDAGKLAFLYVGTDVPSGSRDDPAAVWKAYVGISVNALDASPVFATTTAHDADDPIRRGVCHNFRCYVGTGPQGNGALTDGIGDFLDINIDPTTGGVWVALVDLCNDACAAPTGTADDPGLARAAVGIQVGGVPLRSPTSPEARS